MDTNDKGHIRSEEARLGMKRPTGAGQRPSDWHRGRADKLDRGSIRRMHIPAGPPSWWRGDETI